jgi:hypothetical protein
MKMVFGVLSLLVALGVVALLARQQMHATPGAVHAPDSSLTAVPPASSASPRDASRQMQDQVNRDVQKALQSGMERNDAAERREEGAAP